MATKKQKQEEAESHLIMWMVPFIVVALVFGLYHYAKLKRHYLTGPHVRRVFDMGINGGAMLFSGILAFGYFAAAYFLYRYAPLSLVLTAPMSLVVLNWVGKLQASAFLGVVVDYQQGVVFFPPNDEALDIVDFLLVLPRVRQLTTMDTVLLADVQKITREAGKRLFLHGDFGSRRISFTDKLKRDECIHLITTNGGSAKVMPELE
jgi:hypothetical protein